MESLDRINNLEKAVFDGYNVTRDGDHWMTEGGEDITELCNGVGILNINNWEYYEEPVKEIVGRPYNDKELRIVLLKSPWVEKLDADFTTRLTSFNTTEGVVTAYIDSDGVDAETLFDEYTYLDGSVFGVVE